MICSTRVVPERGMPIIKTGRIVEGLYDSDGVNLNIFFIMENRF